MDLPQTPAEADDQVPPIHPVDAPDVGPESQDVEADDGSSSEEGSGGMIGEGAADASVSDVTEAPSRQAGDGGMIGEG
ncbi:MAG: hypothetical protein KKC14_07570 [Alphaproteobacteria bacterium]|nr:hypothetical protein [Alphaproteobacteria bacterium]